MRALLPDADPTPDLWQAYAYPDGGRRLRANMVSSADGAASWEGRSEALGGPADRAVFKVLRAQADVVIVAAGTARAESYRPVRVADDLAERRRDRGQPAVPPIAVVTSSLDLDLSSPLFVDATTRTIVVTTSSAPASRVAAARDVADVVVVGDDRVDLDAMLEELADRGLRRQLTEGGPGLLGQLVAADLVDELCLTLAPRLAGGDPGRIVAGPSGALLDCELVGALEEDGFLFLRYARHR